MNLSVEELMRKYYGLEASRDEGATESAPERPRPRKQRIETEAGAAPATETVATDGPRPRRSRVKREVATGVADTVA
jgi:hypothetical protein